MERTSSISFYSFSGILHAAAFIFITIYAVDFIEKPILPTLVEFQISQFTEMPKGEQLETPVIQPQQQKELVTETAVAPVAEVIQATPPTVKAAPVKKQKSAPAAKLTAQVPSKSQSKAYEPITAPPLETVDLEDAPAVVAAPVFEEEMITEDLEKVDQETNAEFNQKALDLKAEASNIAEQNEQLHQDALAQIEQEENAMAKTAKEAALARQEAINQALAKENAAKAAAASAALTSRSALVSKKLSAYGAANGVRPLEDLKQMPGNIKPAYDSEDRFKKREGEVIFHALISPKGEPKNFKLIKSSGHRSLDAKTLAALKKWKFFAGQEGWVEIPFAWELKGGPQEKPSLLRR